MQAYLIDPAQAQVSEVDISHGLADIQALIGFDTLESDEISQAGDRLYFDESCFIRQIPGAGRFQFGSLAPIAGRAVVLREAQGAYLAPHMSLDDLLAKLKFMR